MTTLYVLGAVMSAGLLVYLALFTALGARSFEKRTIL